MIEHKDKPHAVTCGANIKNSGNSCCCNGTRWYGHGHRRDSAIAIQGIATFFARLQPVEAWQGIAVDGLFLSDDEPTGYECRPLYANPVTPAAQVDTLRVATEYAHDLVVCLHRDHYADVTAFEPFDDLIGLLSQIDNMVCGWKDPTSTVGNGGAE